MNKKAKHTQPWQERIQQQKESKLTIAAFCKAQKISTSSFYHNKKLLAASPAFIQANVSDPPPTQRTKKTEANPAFILKTNAGPLTLPISTSPEFLANLIRGLS